ncbi:hypothetical protein V5799_029685 [Amblyomma americanum]|uniref:Uncharacterized protein n=1 Tax=Amblyomma americanum TaxID=6943 RepID=A0AAQ4EQL9_AMBAM
MQKSGISAHEELSTVSEKLAEEVAHISSLQQLIEQVERGAGEVLQPASSKLCQKLEQLRCQIEKHELSLRKKLNDKDEALREAELSLLALKEDLEREVAVRMAAEERCSKLAMELEYTTESACEAKQLLRKVQSCLEKGNANLPDCREDLAASVAALVDDKAVQTDGGAAAEREAEAQLTAAGVELDSLRCLLEEVSSQLACEVQARSEAEYSAQHVHEELSTFSEKLAEEVAHSSSLQQRIEKVERGAGEVLQPASSKLCQELEQLRRQIENHELSLRKKLDDKDEALREA